MKERGTCDDRLSVRKPPMERAVLSVLEGRLLTPSHAELFVLEYEKEMRRLTQGPETRAASAAPRLAELERQIEVLGRNMLVSEASPTLHKMLAEMEQEKARLEATRRVSPAKTAEILPHPSLLKLFEEKVKALAETLNDDSARVQASETLASIIESVTIHPGGNPEVEVCGDIVRSCHWPQTRTAPGPEDAEAVL